jgi:hypothetical protein
LNTWPTIFDQRCAPGACNTVRDFREDARVLTCAFLSAWYIWRRVSVIGTGHDPWVTLAGQQHVAMLQRHLRGLHQAYAHGNRRLFYDEVLGAYLLAFFNPTLRSLRTIEDFSSDAQRYPRRLCRSTLSDANALMDARLLLEPLIRHLRGRLPQLRRQDGQLATLLEQVQLVDGSFFDSAATVTWALRDRKPKRDGTDALHHHVRLDLRVNASTLLPTHLQVNGTGCSEPDAACVAIEPGVIYVADRGLGASLAYVQRLLDANADFVLRLPDRHRFESREDQPLEVDDVTDARVLSDRLGRLIGSPHTRAARTVPDRQELREILVLDPRNPDQPIRLLTSLIDVPARVIALLYRWRWQIELFFRWLKVHAHFAHLISRSRNGMTLGFYVAVIAVLLMYLRTGRPMSKYAFNLLGYVAAGQAGSLETTLAILERREWQCARDRERRRRRTKRAVKTS